MSMIVGNISYSVVSPVMTGANTPAPYVSSCSINTVNPFWKCLDGNAETVFRSNISTTCPFTVDLDMGSGNAIVVNGYKLDCSYNGGTWTMNSWQFEGSNDNTTWDVLDARSGIVWTTEPIRTFSFNNSTPYRYYRFNVLTKNGTNSVCINELYLLQEEPTPLEFRKIKEVNLPSEKMDGVDTVYITETGKIFITGKDGKLTPIGGEPTEFMDISSESALISNLWAEEENVAPVPDENSDFISPINLQNVLRANNKVTKDYVGLKVNVAGNSDCQTLINSLDSVLAKKG